MNTCKTCIYNINGICRSEKLEEDYGQKPAERIDMLIYCYQEGGCFSVGDNFGCIHHQEESENLA